MTLRVKQAAQLWMTPLGAGLGGVWQFPTRSAKTRRVSEGFSEVFHHWKPSEANEESCPSRALNPNPGLVTPQGYSKERNKQSCGFWEEKYSSNSGS